MNALTTYSPPAFTMGDIKDVALAIANGGLFGSNNPNAVLTLCLLAQAEGRHPAVVFRDYHIIQGKPAKKADAMLRDFIDAGGKVEWHTLTDEQADATFSHPGGGSARIDWTLKRAKQAKISNPMWDKYPRQMLRSRVVSEGVRTVYPGATSGLYESNEVHDMVADNPQPTQVNVIEHHVEEPEPAAKDPPRTNWGGMFPNRTSLHKGLTRFERELNGCGDLDTLDPLTETAEWQAFVATCEEHAPHYLYGGDPAPEEFKGLLIIEQALRDQFNLEKASHMADLAHT